LDIRIDNHAAFIIFVSIIKVNAISIVLALMISIVGITQHFHHHYLLIDHNMPNIFTFNINVGVITSVSALWSSILASLRELLAAVFFPW